jgi:hypothetical protein
VLRTRGVGSTLGAVTMTQQALERLVIDLRARVLDAEMRLRALEAQEGLTAVTTAVRDAGPSVCPVSSLGTEALSPVTVKVLRAG